MTPCNCEHIRHDPPISKALAPRYETGHEYWALRHCTKRAQYVGLVCDECAEHCVKEYLI